MARFCRRHSYRGGKSPAELVGRLRAAPASANPIAPTILASIVQGSTAHIQLLNTEITRLPLSAGTAQVASRSRVWRRSHFSTMVISNIESNINLAF